MTYLDSVNNSKHFVAVVTDNTSFISKLSIDPTVAFVTNFCTYI